MSDNNEILKDFQQESKNLASEMLVLLEEIEGDFNQVQKLEEFAQKVDRIMGAAKSIALAVPENKTIEQIADYTAICKSVGYKASQIKDKPEFYNVCVALLLDGTEVLNEMLDNLENLTVKELLSDTLLERLRWVSSQFGADVRASVDIKPSSTAGSSPKMSQTDIDQLLKKLGLD